jgi:hypothetical protein
MTGPMIPRDRCDYSAIVDRPALKLPGGAGIVIWTIVNLEVWDIGQPMARQVLPAPTGIPLLPDVPNWSWHEYGMRIGGVALLRSLQETRDRADPLDQRTDLRGLSARRATGQGRRLGIHEPRLRAGADPQGIGPENDDRSLDGRD